MILERANEVRVGDVAASNVEAIYVDGIKQNGVTAFNIEKGWVCRYTEIDGKPVINDNKFATETVSGVVTVDWKN